MEKSMTGTGLELTILLKGVKYLTICLFVWFLEPIFDFIILQIDTAAFLSPYMKSFLDDIKILLGVFVTLLLSVKYLIDIWRSKKKKESK